ncbi:MAG: molybdopterin-dependent oxidoreductase [Anaerolineales bacterium]
MNTKGKHLILGALFGLLTSLPVIALSYLANTLAGLPFIPFDIFDWVARTLPGGLLTFGIDSMVAVITRFNLGQTSSTAKLIEQIMAILQLAGGGAIFGLVLAWLGQRRDLDYGPAGVIGGAVLFLATLAIEASLGTPEAGWLPTIFWFAALFFPWGALLGLTIRRLQTGAEEERIGEFDRRTFLQLVGGGSVAAAAVAVGLGRLVEGAEGQAPTAQSIPELDIEDTSGPAASPPEPTLQARIEPAPGTRPELTSNEDFYRIDINTMPPNVDANSWRLELGGLVDNPMTLTIEDILAMPSQTQALTMQCISNPIGGDLTSTSRWTGVPFAHLLEQAGLQNGALEIAIESVDGFYESVTLEDAMDPRTLLVYAMNGVPLPVEHGFPLRVYIPNRYGMKQPKWITRMEVIDEEGPGYWVDRGWSEEAFAHTTSVIDNVALEGEFEEGDPVPVGGIAWSGDEGISKVEIQVDDGDWMEAQLRVPPLSSLSWVQWRFDWPYSAGNHTFRVRAYDGSGEMQILESNPVRPDGATGIHTMRVRV